MQDPTRLGALERSKDERDFDLGAVSAPITIPSTLNVDLSWLTPNFQGETPTCGAHAAAHFQAILEHQITPTEKQRYSPRYLWTKIKQIDGFPLDVGTDMRSIFKVLQNNGADDFEPLENDVTLPLPTYSSPSAITPDMDANAAQKKIASYAFGNMDFASLCQYVAQKKAVLLLIKCDEQFWQSATPAFTTPKYGHFVTGYDYDPNFLYVVDSADKFFPLKKIAKQYITPTFIKESGTGLDIPPEQIRAIIQNSQALVTQVVNSPIPLEQKTDLLSQITLLIKLLASFFQQPKVGSSSQQMLNYSLFRSKTFWTIALGVAIYIATNLNNPTADTIAVLLGIVASYFHLKTGQSTTGSN